MMGRIKWNISAGAVLLLALMYFFDGSGMLSALAAAALAHELGHVAALRACGRRLTRVSLGVFGLELDYAGPLQGRQALACIAMGPLAGGLYGIAACTLGGSFGRTSGALSVLLSGFNLMPVLPLDGGRLAAVLVGEPFARKLSRWAALLLLFCGVWLFACFRSVSLLVMGAWLAVSNFCVGAHL